MKLVSAPIFLSILATIYAAEDYYTDEKGKTYMIGNYGQKIYEHDEGRNSPTDEVHFTNQNEFTDFGWELFKRMNNRAIENYVVSSLPPQVLLSLISEKANGTTKQEIDEAIKISDFKKLGKLTKALKKEDTARTLQISSVFFVNRNNGQSISKEYTQHALKAEVDIMLLNFTDTVSTQKKYNDWLSTATKGVINDQQLTLDSNTKMIMSSAMYFKGDWLFEFSKPVPGKFESTHGPVDVEMISTTYKKYHYGYLSNDNGEWVSIPYNSTEAMIILLPKKDKFPELQDFLHVTKSHDISDIVDIIADVYPPHTLVNITLPKFKIRSTVDLKAPLEKMGMSKIFSEQSEYYPFEQTSPLQVSSATQDCSLEVTETGSVGASVTKFSIVALSIQAKVNEASFVVDRPFVAIIANRVHRIPYFIAKVTNPSLT